jgi:SAM-dependent methyltransferase
VYGTGFFEHLTASPDRLIAFQQSMVARSQVEAADLLRAHDFSGYQHVIDVGGGFGVTLTAILTAYPALRGTLFDRPEVTQAAHARLTAAGVEARCAVVAGDAFDAVPDGGDLYLLSRVIHDWHDDDAVRILRSCRRVMRDDARLVLVEAIIADQPCDQPGAVLMDLHMLVLGLGKERTTAEFSALLARAGLALPHAAQASGRTGISIIEAGCA